MEIIFSTIEVAHEDERRKLSAIFNGDFTAKQVKLLQIKKESILGNHYHHYRELFYILHGKATFVLEEIHTKEHQVIEMREGDRLIVGPEIAHMVNMSGGTVTIEATEQPYHSPQQNDFRYEVK